jgi:hypothetical protein
MAAAVPGGAATTDHPQAFAPFAVSAFVPVAVSLLNAGHRKEAAAVFEAAVIANPRDAIAINNWAFCAQQTKA